MQVLKMAWVIAWVTLSVTLRRLLKGPRHPVWTWRAEVVARVMRAQSHRDTHDDPARVRAMMLDAPIPRQLARALTLEEIQLAGLPTSRFTPAGWSHGGATILYLHGGGYVFCSPGTHRDLVARLAHAADARCLSLDYRLAPEHPFPAAVDDGLAAYKAALDASPPERLIIAGDSAGGGLALATLLRARAAGLPMPAAAVLMSPWVDLTVSGHSALSNAPFCFLNKAILDRYTLHYLQGHDPLDPLASPIRADLTGLPPMMILTGDAEALYSEDVDLARRAPEHGVDVDLVVAPGMIHAWPALAPVLPEGRAAIERIASFIKSTLARSPSHA